jgi:hypothetical protein
MDGVLDRIRGSLWLAQVVAFATLLRSIALDRWITVLAAVLLIGGAFVAQRGKTWGLALAFAAAAAFPVAWLIGIAPFWFCLVGVAGAIPFLQALPSLVRFDRRATGVLGAITIAMGAAGAMLWKEYALDVFRSVPMLRPSFYPHHGLALAALLAVGLVALVKRRPSQEPRLRVATDSAVRIGAEEELLEELEEPQAARAAISASNKRRY